MVILWNQSLTISGKIKKEMDKKCARYSETYPVEYNFEIERIDSAIKLYRKEILKEINALLQDKEALINSDFERSLVDEEYYKEKEYNPVWLIFKGNKSTWLNFLPSLKDILVDIKFNKCYLSILKPGYTISSYNGGKTSLRYTICIDESEDFLILNNKVLNFKNGLIWDHSLIHHYSNNGQKNGIYLHIELEKELPMTVQALYKLSTVIDNLNKV